MRAKPSVLRVTRTTRNTVCQLRGDCYLRPVNGLPGALITICSPSLSSSNWCLIFVLQFSKFLVQHRAALSLQVSHKSRHRHLRWNLYQNMNMVRAHLPFQETNSFPFTQLPQDFSYLCSFFLIEYFSPVLGCKHYMVLAVPFCVR